MPDPKTKAEGAPDDGYRLEEQVGFLLRKAHQRATSIFQATIGDPSVTPTQFSALSKLYDAGELSQNKLGRMIAMDPATIQGVIRRLTARRLIARKADKRDKRRASLTLTPAGRAMIAGLRRNGTTVSSRTLSPLGPAEQKDFLALLARLG